jgi:hypothetical protein
MKCAAWKIVCVGAIVSLVSAIPGRAQNGDNDGCSDASLKGDYAFTIHGESIGVLVPQMNAPPKLLPFVSALLADGVAITHFDGAGHLSQVDFIMRNGTSAATPATPITENGFRSAENGKYSVSPDCTGTFAVTFPDTSEIDVAFVLAKHGSEIRTVVTRQHVPLLPPPIIPAGATCAVATGGCDLGVQIRSDGVKL